MAARDMFICEPLCYLFRKFGNCANDSIKSIMCGFYTVGDISGAKELLFKTAENLNIDGLPRLVSRRKTEGVERSRQEIEDILGLLEVLDEKQQMGLLPKFVALDPAKLPPFKTDALELCMLTLRVAALEEQLSGVVAKCIDTVAAAKTEIPNRMLQEDINDSGERTVSMNKTTEKVKAKKQAMWADVAKDLNDDDFVVVTRKTKSHANQQTAKNGPDNVIQRRNIRGTKVMSAETDTQQVTAVPRRVMAFLGRLKLDTTEEHVVELMKNAGMKEPRCKKLESKEGKTFRTAAFMVSCSMLSEKEFFEETNWPEGCELRDWYFKNNK